MLRARVIPCLLIKNRGLVKTRQFAAPKYVGDPLNAVRIFNEKAVDELIVLDIDATAQAREPDYAMIQSLAAECRMPLCYGGGVKSAAQAERIVSLGVEKVAVGAAAAEDPFLVEAMARTLGRQSVIVVADAKRVGNGYEVWVRNATRRSDVDLPAFAKRMVALGAGEIVLNSIDRDGMMGGYDLEMISLVRGVVSVPITALGGAGSLADIRALFERFGIIGAAAGSLFVFKGAYRAVLINYPGPGDKQALFLAAAK